MKTESFWWRLYASNRNEPPRLSHQKTSGTTTRLCFSVAHHCTKNREKNTALPSQPTIFQSPQSMPRNLWSIQSQFANKSIYSEGLSRFLRQVTNRIRGKATEPRA